ncbi:MAG: acyltransferase [Oscillospiraceae bacterium]|nr:acyltransferase [Oscillospiraceae bacterium]
MKEKESIEFEGIRFDGVQVLRAASMLMIALYHIDMFYNTGLRMDRCVHIFFVISAFMVMYTTRKDVKHFIRKRIIKIVPLYWLLTFLTFFAAISVPGIIPQAPGVRDLVLSLFFIPYSRDGIRGADAVRPLVGPAHTLMSEMFFYLLFFVSAKADHKKRGLIASAVLIVLVALGYWFDFYEIPILYTYTSDRLADFVGGILLFYIAEYIFKRNGFRIGICRSAVLLVISAVAGGILISAENISMPLKVGLSMICVAGFTVAFFDIRAPRILVTAGDLSYSFYLIHYYVILIIKTLLDPMNVWSVKSGLCAAAAICAGLIFGWLSYRIIEIGFAGFLKKRLIRASEQ